MATTVDHIIVAKAGDIRDCAECHSEGIERLVLINLYWIASLRSQ
jgi:hypothetical protein